MRVFLTALLLAVVAGCNTLPPEEGGSYSYIGYDEDGEVIVAGTLVLDFESHPNEEIESAIEGTWLLSAVGDAEVPGPQTDTGGHVENTKAIGRTLVKELGKLPP